MTICVLSANTAVDRTLLVPGVAPGKVQRAQRSHVGAGGRGLNVARVLRQLGEPVRVIGFLGDAASTFIREECARLGLEQRWVDIAEETRTCVILVDPETETQTVINEEGPTVTAGEVERLCEEITHHVAPGDLLCISGSAPLGVPDDLYGNIAHEVAARGVKVLADVGGRELKMVAGAHPWALAPNYEESVAAFGASNSPEDMACRLATDADYALLTLGAEGVLFAAGEELLAMRPPRVRTVNAVGSGDAFVAGFLTGIAREMDPIEAVRLGMACGAANAARFEPGIGSPAELEVLLSEGADGTGG